MRGVRAFPNLPLPLAAGFVLLVAMVSASLVLAVQLSQSVQETARMSDYRRAITDVFNQARDAEIGQRGYLLTNDPAFLDPYNAAVAQLGPALERLRSVDGDQSARAVAELAPLARAKMAELDTTIVLMRQGQAAKALALVREGRGKQIMDRMRVVFDRARASALDRTTVLQARSIVVVRVLTIGLLIGMAAIIALSLLWLRQSRDQLDFVERARIAAQDALAALQAESAARTASEAQVRQLQKMESIGQLTGGIAHDFNNMLAVVLGNLELAQRRLTGSPERLAKLLENAREGATRAATLTARLLAFSRRQPLAPAPVDASKLLDGLCEMLGRTLGETIAFECVNSAGLWRCYVDPGEVENAIVNLAVNARDAMPDGGKLTLETANAFIDDRYALTHSEVEPGQYVAICVTDTGTGMTQDIIDRAFDPFFTTKPVGKGTGLGLSQVFGFVKQSGGHVAIYSEVGQGTTVKLYLPRVVGSGAAVSPSSAQDEGLPGSASEVILVVEDERRVRQFAVDVLSELGYTAIEAETPVAALEIIKMRPDITLLFTDIVIPDMTGRRLSDLARIERPDLKVLYTTGYTRNAVVHNGMVDVGIAFLPKPYTIGDLARKVRQVLDGGGVNRTA